MAKSYKKGTEMFVNPYNFIELQKGIRKDKDYRSIKEQKDLLTGEITCSLETLTPLFIPNPTTNNAYPETVRRLVNNRDVKPKSYDFFTYNDLSNLNDEDADPGSPVLPGSEIRGVIRSAFEALTNSCLSSINDDTVLYKRTTIPADPGRLYFSDGQWYIKPCERIGIALKKAGNDPNDFSVQIQELHEGQQVFIKIGGYYKTRNGFDAFRLVNKISTSLNKDCPDSGYFHKGESFMRKHHESIFVEINRPEPIEIPEKAVMAMKKNIELYRDDTVNIDLKRGHCGYRHINLDNFKTSGALIYYRERNGRYYLCPAAIGREVFSNRLSDIIADYAPCTSIKKLCPTCAIFGIAGKERSEDSAAASRVRLTDAKVIECRDEPLDYYDRVTILPELASPKPSATEFYLVKPDNADMWNYDYAFSWVRDKKTNKKIENQIQNYEPTIRGRKFYWHKAIQQAPSAGNRVSERNVAIRPLRCGIQFTFNVYFNDITKQELNQILWVLEIGGHNENAHKMGMGKPLGLGSVRINIINVKVRKIELKNSTIEYRLDTIDHTSHRQNNACELLGCTDSILSQYLKITNYANPPEHVSYPMNQGGTRVYEWFVGNKQADEGGGTGTNPVITQILPTLKKNSVSMNKYETYEKQRK